MVPDVLPPPPTPTANHELSDISVSDVPDPVVLAAEAKDTAKAKDTKEKRYQKQ